MSNSLLVGLSRQVALGRELDVVANNIANLNTTGFKGDGAVFEEYIAPIARNTGLSGNDRRVSFVQDRATWVDMSQGGIQQTANPLDIAIDGKGFLTVQTPRGERYTRNGGLQINQTGELVTSEGYQVLGESGPIVFQPKDRDVSISKDGTISVREGNLARTESLRGKLRVVSFERPGQLQKDGTGTFKAPESQQPQQDKESRVIQWALEKSNVRAVVEMTRMIEVTRSYTQVATLLQQQGDLQRSSIDKLAEVPA
jgi:flagellar basal-body rod protein FlgF